MCQCSCVHSLSAGLCCGLLYKLPLSDSPWSYSPHSREARFLSESERSLTVLCKESNLNCQPFQRADSVSAISLICHPGYLTVVQPSGAPFVIKGTRLQRGNTMDKIYLSDLLKQTFCTYNKTAQWIYSKHCNIMWERAVRGLWMCVYVNTKKHGVIKSIWQHTTFISAMPRSQMLYTEKNISPCSPLHPCIILWVTTFINHLTRVYQYRPLESCPVLYSIP